MRRPADRFTHTPHMIRPAAHPLARKPGCLSPEIP